MENHILSTIFAVVLMVTAIGLPVVLFFIWYWKHGKKQLALAQEFETTYEKVKFDIDTLEINSKNFELIRVELKALCRLKFKNREKTEVLWTTYLKRFGKEYCKRLIA